MKILVTGASGLLGHEICKQLKEAGNEVWAIDNHSRSSIVPPCDQFLSIDLINNTLRKLGFLPLHLQMQQFL